MGYPKVRPIRYANEIEPKETNQVKINNYYIAWLIILSIIMFLYICLEYQIFDFPNTLTWVGLEWAILSTGSFILILWQVLAPFIIIPVLALILVSLSEN